MASVSNGFDDYGSSSDEFDDDGLEEPTTSGAPTQTQQTARKRRCRYTEEERRVRRRLANRESARRMRAKRSQAVQELEYSVQRLSERNKQLEQRNQEYVRSLDRMKVEFDALKQQVHGSHQTHSVGTANTGAATVGSPPHLQQRRDPASGDAQYGGASVSSQQQHLSGSMAGLQQEQHARSTLSNSSIQQVLVGFPFSGPDAAAAAGVVSINTEELLKMQQQLQHCSRTSHGVAPSPKHLAVESDADIMFHPDTLAAAATAAGQQQQLWLEQQWRQQMHGLAAGDPAAASAAVATAAAVGIPGGPTSLSGLQLDPAAAAAAQRGLVHPVVLAAQGLAGTADSLLNPAGFLAPGLLNPGQFPPHLLNPDTTGWLHHQHYQQQQQQVSGRSGSNGQPSSSGIPDTPTFDQAALTRFPSGLKAMNGSLNWTGSPLTNASSGLSHAPASTVVRHESGQQLQQLVPQQPGAPDDSLAAAAAAVVPGQTQTQQQHQRPGGLDIMSRLAMHGQMAAAAGFRNQQQQQQQAGGLPAAAHHSKLCRDSHHLLSLLPGSDPMLFQGFQPRSNSGQSNHNSADDLIDELLRTLPETDADMGEPVQAETAAAAAAGMDLAAAHEQYLSQQQQQPPAVRAEHGRVATPPAAAAAGSGGGSGVVTEHQQQQQPAAPAQAQHTAAGSAEQQQQAPAAAAAALPIAHSSSSGGPHEMLKAPVQADSSARPCVSVTSLCNAFVTSSLGAKKRCYGGQQLTLPMVSEESQLHEPQLIGQQQQQQTDGSGSGLDTVMQCRLPNLQQQQQQEQHQIFCQQQQERLAFGAAPTTVNTDFLTAAAAAAPAATLAAKGNVVQGLLSDNPAICVPMITEPLPTAAGGSSQVPTGFVPATSAAAAAAALLHDTSLDPFEHWASRHGGAGDKGKELLHNLNNMLVTDVPPAPVGLYGPVATASQQQQQQQFSAGDHPRGRGHAHTHHGSSSYRQQQQHWDMLATASAEHGRKKRFPLKTPSRFSHLTKTAASDPLAAARQRFSAGDVSLMAGTEMTASICHGSSGHPFAAGAATAAGSRRRMRRRGSGDGSAIGPVSCLSRNSNAAAAAAAAAREIFAPDRETTDNMTQCDTQCNTADDGAVVPAVSECVVNSNAKAAWKHLGGEVMSEPCDKGAVSSSGINDGCRSFGSEPVGNPAARLAQQQQHWPATLHPQQQQQQFGISPQLHAMQMQLQQQILRGKGAQQQQQQQQDPGNFAPGFDLAAAAAVGDPSSSRPNLAASAVAPASAAVLSAAAAAAITSGAVTSPPAAAAAKPPVQLSTFALHCAPSTAAAAAANPPVQLSPFTLHCPPLAVAAAAEAPEGEESFAHVVPSVSQSTLPSSPQEQQQVVDQICNRHDDVMSEDVIQGEDYARSAAEEYMIADSPPQLDALLAAMHSQEQQQQQQQHMMQ